MTPNCKGVSSPGLLGRQPLGEASADLGQCPPLSPPLNGLLHKQDTMASTGETLPEALGVRSEMLHFVLYLIHLVNQGVHRQVTRYGNVDRSQAEEGRLGTSGCSPVRPVGSKEVSAPTFKTQI